MWPVLRNFSRSYSSTAITTTTRPPMLGDRHRFGAGQVDQPAEAVLRVFRAQGLHATPRQCSIHFWPRLSQNTMDSGFRCGPCGVSNRVRVTAARNCVSRNGRQTASPFRSCLRTVAGAAPGTTAVPSSHLRHALPLPQIRRMRRMRRQQRVLPAPPADTAATPTAAGTAAPSCDQDPAREQSLGSMPPPPPDDAPPPTAPLPASRPPRALAARGRSSRPSSTFRTSPQQVGWGFFSDHTWGLLGDP